MSLTNAGPVCNHDDVISFRSEICNRRLEPSHRTPTYRDVCILFDRYRDAVPHNKWLAIDGPLNRLSYDHSGAANLACSIPEACAAGGLSRSMLCLALKDGRLFARKTGARAIIEDAELRRLIASLPTTRGRHAA